MAKRKKVVRKKVAPKRIARKVVKRRATPKKAVVKKSSPTKVSSKKSVQKPNFNWKFPAEDIYFLRIELLFLSVVTIGVFLFMFFQLSNKILPSLAVTIGFVALYSIIQHLMKHVRHIEEEYEISGDHLHIKRRVNNKLIHHHKVHRNDIDLHKVDKTFLGAYIVVGGKRHTLFFNTKKEIEFLEKWILKRKKN